MSSKDAAGSAMDGTARSKAKYNPLPGDITYTVSREMLEQVKFEIDGSEKFIHVKYDDSQEKVAAWPSGDISRKGDVLVAVDGRSTLVRKSFPRILVYLNELRSKRAYTLTFRLPQVALDAKPPVSTRTFYDANTGGIEGYLNKLSKGNLFSRPKWEVRYFVLNPTSLEIRRFKTRADVAGKKFDVVKLSDIASVTEDIEQPAMEDGEEAQAALVNSKYITRFEITFKESGAKRSFIAFNPEDTRVWVSRIATLIGQVTMTTESTDESNTGPAAEELKPVDASADAAASAPVEPATPGFGCPPTPLTDGDVKAEAAPVVVAAGGAGAEEKAPEQGEEKQEGDKSEEEEGGEDAELPLPEPVKTPSFVIVTPAKKAVAPPPVPITGRGEEKDSSEEKPARAPNASPPQPWATTDHNPTIVLPDITDAREESESESDSESESEGEEGEKKKEKKVKAAAGGEGEKPKKKKKKAKATEGEEGKPKKTKKKKAASATSTPATSGKSAVSGASSKKKSSAKEPVADKAALLAKTPASAKDVKALARALRTAK